MISPSPFVALVRMNAPNVVPSDELPSTVILVCVSDATDPGVMVMNALSTLALVFTHQLLRMMTSDTPYSQAMLMADLNVAPGIAATSVLSRTITFPSMIVRFMSVSDDVLPKKSTP